MQTLRKKTSPFKYKHESSRFGGEGQCFKAKLIGILEVSEARGDRMCQEALSDLKMAIRAAGEHKQRITVHIALDGLRLRDEKTGDCLYHHPVHKISFIAQDMTDSRAFGYIFGSPDTGHRFFGIKTDKAASQVVIAMRDLFQVVFALKKKEIELAKQHLEKNCLYNSPLFSDTSSNKSITPELPAKYEAIKSESKASASSAETRMSGTAVANLVDLQLELNSLQQGLHQMEKITPSETYGSKDDPFGDSFTSFPNPILPPPPSSGKERSSRNSESSGIFSPKTPHTGDSLTTTSGIDSYPFTTLPKTEFKLSRDLSSSHEEPSSGEWFTPSNSLFEETSLVSSETLQKTAKDEQLEQTKKDILSQFDVFTELDPLGTGRSKPYIDKKNFFQELKNPPKKVLNDLVTQNQNDPKDLGAKILTTSITPKNLSGFDSDPFGEDPFVSLDPFAEAEFKQDPFEKDFIDYKKPSKNEHLLTKPLSKSPNALKLNSSTLSTSPKNVKFNETETETMEVSDAPEPPPRPESTILQIKPPPLPPKKQTNDIIVKPPPRPPHIEDSMYDYMRSYETGPKSLESSKDADQSPALPIPMRKTKFESDFMTAPERPAKHFPAHSFEDDYLTPIQISKPSEFEGHVLLPPPSGNRSRSPNTEVTGSTTINTQVNGTNNLGDSLNNTLEGLDITLSQLTLNSLNELAVKLNIPTSQLSNMTLVQLTEYLSNVIKSKSHASNSSAVKCDGNENNASVEFPAFKADFESNFGNSNVQVVDRYAVFRELINEEIKQTKIDTEPVEFRESEPEQKSTSISVATTNKLLSNDSTIEDRYAALREIVENDLLKTEQNIIDEKKDNSNIVDDNAGVEESEVELNEIKESGTNSIVNDSNNEGNINEKSYIDYNKEIEENGKDVESLKSPKSPLKIPLKSPVPSAITEIIQNNVRLNSGSLSDIVSGSSPEIDNTISNFEVGMKISDTTGESWAIFDQSSNQQESINEKQGVQSEEGLSPWSSDSKDGNGSHSDYYRPGDSESGGDRWNRKTDKREQEGWWDTSAEPEIPYNSSNRRSTDSYDEEFYECHDRPRRRRPGGRGSQGGSQGGGGHSSSSRDVSPWEEEPKRRDGRSERISWSRTSKQQFERHHERRPTDSWDDEDDYEYGDPRRFHWGAGSRESDRHSAGSRDDGEPRERWNEEWSDDRRRRRRRDTDRDHWCCPDWEEVEYDKHPSRYSRWSNIGTPPGKWRDRKYDDKYYKREESPWEDEYPVEKEEIHPSHYVGSRRNWKRPNSASEMERKGDFKTRHIGGSDGERDRRYKGSRRSRSRDSQYSEPPYRHKPETNSLTRSSYKGKSHGQYIKSQFESEFPDSSNKKQLDAIQLDIGAKKTFTLQNRKKKESPNSEENMNTFPRKSSKAKQSFENDFKPEIRSSKCEFENNFRIEPEFPVTIKSAKLKQQHSMIELQRKPSRESKPRGYQSRSKSLFEDDFATNKIDHIEDKTISVIKEEIDIGEENDCFSVTNASNSNRLSKRLSGGLRTDLKKSESVNIFSRENDPFDDDFFCENEGDVHIFDNASDRKELRNSDNRWTDNFNT